MWKLDLYLFLKARDVAHVLSVSPANTGQRVKGNNQCTYDTKKVVSLLWQKTEDVNLVFFGYIYISLHSLNLASEKTSVIV